MAERQSEPNLSDVLSRLEVASQEPDESLKPELASLEAEIGHAAQTLYARFDELGGRCVSPQKALNESRFIQAQDGFQTLQSKYAEQWIQTHLDSLVIPGTKEFVRLAQEVDPTNVRGYIDLLPSVLGDGMIHNGIFRLDSLVQVPLNVLAPLAYTNDTELKGQETAGRLYTGLRRLAEVAGDGTLYDHWKLYGPTKDDLVRQGVFLKDSYPNIRPNDVVSQVRKVGFSPNRLEVTPFGTALRLTEPLIEPQLSFRTPTSVNPQGSQF